MNFHPFEETLDEYFDGIKNYLDPPSMQFKIDSFYESVTKFKKDYLELNEKIRDMESKIHKLDSDLGVLAEMGKALDSKSAKERIKQICEDYISEHKLQDIKSALAQMYEQKTSFLKALTPIVGTFDETGATVTCPVCFENQVSMYNTHCGHTLCQKCAIQIINRCSICRGPVNYKTLIFSY